LLQALHALASELRVLPAELSLELQLLQLLAEVEARTFQYVSRLMATPLTVTTVSFGSSTCSRRMLTPISPSTTTTVAAMTRYRMVC
jgi:hypothetical protein